MSKNLLFKLISLRNVCYESFTSSLLAVEIIENSCPSDCESSSKKFSRSHRFTPVSLHAVLTIFKFASRSTCSGLDCSNRGCQWSGSGRTFFSNAVQLPQWIFPFTVVSMTLIWFPTQQDTNDLTKTKMALGGFCWSIFNFKQITAVAGGVLWKYLLKSSLFLCKFSVVKWTYDTPLR